jgi:LacI family transcriptional regulator
MVISGHPSQRYLHLLTTLSTSATITHMANKTQDLQYRRPTLRDVAEEAGTSVKTVSRVVNNEGGVSPGLLKRVTRAIEVLGYRPHHAAAALRSTSAATRTIGFVQVDVGNPFFASVFRGIEDVAHDNAVLVLTASSDADNTRQNETIGAFISRRVDGLIVIPVGEDLDLLETEVTKHGTPVVFLDLMPPKLIGDVVLSDHFGGAFTATKHLLDQGHRRMGFLSHADPASYYSAGERLRGYTAGLEQAGIDLDPSLVIQGVDTPALGATATRRLMSLPEPPTAVLASHNYSAIGLVQAVHELGLAQRVATIGFADIELADVVEPGLTVVVQDPRDLGRVAGEMLFRRLDGFTGPPEIVVRDVTLLHRGSGEIRNQERM